MKIDMRAVRIVTASQGSWRYQKPYRLAWYKAVLAKSGSVIWVSVGRSHKLSWPQIKKFGYDKAYRIGSLHNKKVSLDEAIREIGLRKVREIEMRGWKFS